MSRTEFSTDVKQLVQHLKESFGFNGVNDAAKLFAVHGNLFTLQGAEHLGPASHTSKSANRYATTLIALCDLLRETVCSDAAVTIY